MPFFGKLRIYFEKYEHDEPSAEKEAKNLLIFNEKKGFLFIAVFLQGWDLGQLQQPKIFFQIQLNY